MLEASTIGLQEPALKSIDYLTIEKEDFPKFKTFLNTFKFRDDETEILGELYEN